MPKKVFKEVNWTTTLWLSFFLGIFGVDRFYMGQTKTGILKLITVGGLGFWYLIDLILIMSSHNFENIKWKFPKNKTIHIIAICLLILIAMFSGSEPTTQTQDTIIKSTIDSQNTPIIQYMDSKYINKSIEAMLPLQSELPVKFKIDTIENLTDTYARSYIDLRVLMDSGIRLTASKVEKIYIYPDEESEQDITTIEIKIFNFSQIDHTQSAYDKIFKQFFLDEIKNPISTKCRVESGDKVDNWNGFSHAICIKKNVIFDIMVNGKTEYKPKEYLYNLMRVVDEKIN